MGRCIWGTLLGLLMVGCVPPYAERAGTAGPATPTPTAPPTEAPPPVAPPEPAPPSDEEVPPEPELGEEPAPTGIDVNWKYFAGKAADEQLAPLGGPEVEAQAGPWKCTISKQETATEGSSPVARKRTISCKHFTNLAVETSVTCDLERTANDVTLTLGSDAVVVACEAK